MHEEDPQTQQLQAQEEAPAAVADVTVITPLGKQVHLPAIPGTDMVSAIKQLLGEIAETCSYTAYHLLWEGAEGEEPVQLNDFVEIMAYRFTAEPCTLKMVLDNYDARSAKVHLRRFRELLQFPPVDKNFLDEQAKVAAEEKADEEKTSAEETAAANTEAETGATTAAVSAETESAAAAGGDEAKENGELSEEQLKQWTKMLEERAAHNAKLRRLLPEQDVELHVSLADLADFTLDRLVDAPAVDLKPVKCLNGVVYSSWNPPPATRAMQGDLMYLEVHTLDDGVLHITSTPAGFYVNNTSHNGFDPRPAANCHFSHELLYTLLSASPSFFNAWNSAVERVTKIHALSENPLVSISANLNAGRVSSIFVKPQWALPTNYGTPKAHQADPSRAEAAFLDSFGLDDRGALREWYVVFRFCAFMCLHMFAYVCVPCFAVPCHAIFSTRRCWDDLPAPAFPWCGICHPCSREDQHSFTLRHACLVHDGIGVITALTFPRFSTWILDCCLETLFGMWFVV